MTYIADDRRYESHEMRAAYDSRYVIDSRVITSKAARKAAFAEADRYYLEMADIRKRARAMDADDPRRASCIKAFERCAALRSEIFERIRKYGESVEAKS